MTTKALLGMLNPDHSVMATYITTNGNGLLPILIHSYTNQAEVTDLLVQGFLKELSPAQTTPELESGHSTTATEPIEFADVATFYQAKPDNGTKHPRVPEVYLFDPSENTWVQHFVNEGDV